MIAQGEDFVTAPQLVLPISPYTVDGYKFGERVRSRIILWARHLGDDVIASAGTSVHAIGDGVVVWAEMRGGNKEKRNWGGIVILGHQHKDTGEPFFSLYGHIRGFSCSVGDQVKMNDTIGEIAAGNTTENGWWKQAHLHFGIYAGPWVGQVLPGYARPFAGRTKMHWWRNPQSFIAEYNQSET